MELVSAFKDGSAALRANPILLVAGLLVGAGSQLQYVNQVIDSPLVSTGASLGWLVVFPFVLGGFVGTARAAIEGTDTSIRQFVTTARTHYVRLLSATVAFLLIILGTAIGLGIVGLVFGIGSMALAAIHEMAAFVGGIVSLIVWLVSLFVVIMFVQFYDAAIVIEEQSVADSFRRSVALVRSNLTSVIGFSVVWSLSLNIFLIPEYLVQLTATDAAPGEVLPVDIGIPIAVLLPIGLVLSAVGFAYLYTVYTAYYLQLVSDSPLPTETA
jgi:hypothetical protein